MRSCRNSKNRICVIDLIYFKLPCLGENFFLSPTAFNHTLKFSSFKFLIVLSGLPIKYPSVEDDAPVEDPFNGMSPLHWVVTGMSFVVLSLFRHEGLGFYADRSHRLTTFSNFCQMPIRNCTIRRSKSATRTEMDT